MRIALSLVVLWGVPACLLHGQESTVSGHVRDERLRPVHGALVSLSLSPRPGERAKPHNVSTRTGRDGTFTAAVPQGRYRLCAQLAGSELLDSCTWAVSPTLVDTAGAKALAAPAITLKRGYPVEVAVEDQGKVMAELAARGPSVPLLIGIRGGSGMFLPMEAKAKRGEAQEFRLLVPRDMPLELSVYSKELKLTDDKGAAVDAKKGLKTSIKLSGPRTQKRFTFRVTGKQAAEKL